MEEYIEDSIALYQYKIEEYGKIKGAIKSSGAKKIRFRVETNHWYGFDEPFWIKRKHKLEISKEAMLNLLDLAIEKEREKINKLIDAEIEIRRREDEENAKDRR